MKIWVEYYIIFSASLLNNFTISIWVDSPLLREILELLILKTAALIEPTKELTMSSA